jgi:hypothetical protein
MARNGMREFTRLTIDSIGPCLHTQQHKVTAHGQSTNNENASSMLHKKNFFYYHHGNGAR